MHNTEKSQAEHEAAMKKLYAEVRQKEYKQVLEKIEKEKKQAKHQMKYNYDLKNNQIYGTRLQMLADMLQDDKKYTVYNKVPHSSEMFGEDGKPIMPTTVKLLIKW